ncbi:MAG: NAD-dependent dehydratase [Pseudomonadota bacterium]
MKIERLLLLGGTGAVGKAALAQALADIDILQVIAPTRRALPAHPKLINPLLDFDNLPLRYDGASLALQQAFTCDAVVCALGTTLKQAGSKAAFNAIDHDLVLSLARLAQAGGAQHFALNSSLGANANSSFYLRTKAAVEKALLGMGFARTVIVRPSLIDSDRQGQRPMEHLGVMVMRFARPLIPARYRAVTPEAIAHGLLAGVKNNTPGVVFVESEALQ